MRRTAKEIAPTADAAPKLVYKLEELERAKPIDLTLTTEFLAGVLTAEESQFRVEAPGRLQGELSAVDDGALLRANLTCQIVTECSRCLQPVAEDLSFPVVMRYVPRPKLAARENEIQPSPHAERDGSFDPRDLDEEPFDNRRIDLTPAIREQFILALPMKAVCRDDCQGLCAICGQNRNDQACECRQESTDPRWARLKEMKLQN